MTRVAVVGLGGMGSRIAGRLLSAGNDVIVWNRSPQKVGALGAIGALAATTPAEAARRADVLITMVADPAALRAVTEGPDGVAAGAGTPLTVVEMSTVGPAAVARLASVLPSGVALVDAPVLGSLAEAEIGSLAIFAGGPAPVVHRVTPVLSVLGSITSVGDLGAGAAAKLVANAVMFGTLAVLGEALALARGLGLSSDAAYDVLSFTPLAAQAERRRGAIESGDFPPRFSLRLAHKDARLVEEAAASAGLDLRLTDAARTWLEQAEDNGLGDRDYTAMLATILNSSALRALPAAPPRSTPVVSARDAPPLHCDGLIVDLDGVVWRAGEPIRGAAEAMAAIRAMGTRVLFLSNDPASSQAQIAARLRELGIPATAADVLTSAAATARVLEGLEDLPGRRALVVGPRALHDEIQAAGFELVSADEARQAGVVVVGGHETFDYHELRQAALAVRNGARLFATGRDAVFPTPDGPWPATGAILAAVETASGVTATVVGKPEPVLFEMARKALGGCERIAVVGDHLIADISGAKRAGLGAILVLTGASSLADLERAAIRPDLTVEDLAAYAEAIRA